MGRHYRWNRVVAAVGYGGTIGAATALAATPAVYYPLVACGATDAWAEGVATLVFGAIVVAMVAAFVAAEVRAQQVERRGDRRLCRECGYSLRHLPPVTWECPECRTPFRRP